MNVLKWLTGRFSNRGKALSLYKLAMVKAKKHDHQGAIDAYTRVIDMPNTPADVKAMVLYNRALTHVASKDEQQGADDLNALLAMNEAPAKVKEMARQKLVRMQSRA